MISFEHAKGMVWNRDLDEFIEDVDDSEDESPDRVYTFEVAKTKEQEENVTARQGFNASLYHLLTDR